MRGGVATEGNAGISFCLSIIMIGGKACRVVGNKSLDPGGSDLDNKRSRQEESAGWTSALTSAINRGMIS